VHAPAAAAWRTTALATRRAAPTRWTARCRQAARRHGASAVKDTTTLPFAAPASRPRRWTGCRR
jgi:hypothetical protein